MIQSAMAASNAQVWFITIGGSSAGGGFSSGAPAFASAAIIAAFSALEAAIFKYGRYRYEWLKTFENLGTPHNFAYYYYSTGNYNYLKLEQQEGQSVRGLNIRKYLKEGEDTVTNEITAQNIKINNLRRERSVFLSTGNHKIEYPPNYKTYDKESMTFLGENGLRETGKSSAIYKNIASPYVTLKNYMPSQYGTINSIRWLTTGYRGDLLNPRKGCLSIFGGDTFISRHTLKRKHSQFLINSIGQSDRTPFNYFFYNNIGRNPLFYVSYGVDKDFEGGGKIFPDVVNEFNMDNLESRRNYYIPPSKFYLFYYGIPSFLCETRINTNFRYAEKDLDRQFYPQVGDVGDWTQEVNVSIRQPEFFFYNKAYSKQVTRFKNRVLAENYSKDFNDCKTDFPNGIISSLPDNSENNSYDPWLIYRPLDFFEFPTNYGKLIDVQGIENEAIFTRFENTSILYNKVDYTNDDGQNPSKTFLGGTSFFQRRSASFYNAQLGFGGTQNTASVSCEFGHFHVDAKRGQVIQTQPSGQQMEEISSLINGKPSGMRAWFKEHLPFKILKYFKDVDIDNNYNGIGITMAWDSRYRRVFITKKDYIPKVDCIAYKNGNFFYECAQSSCEQDNLVVNGDFNTDLSGWELEEEGQYTWNNGKAWNIGGSDEYCFMSQDILEIGKTYKISMNVTLNEECQNRHVRVRAGSNISEHFTTTQLIDIELECTDSTLFTIETFFECGATLEEAISIDNVCVIESSPKKKIELTDSKFFSDVSWTIAYSPILGAWMSFYDFKPNYYVSHNEYFQSGVNSEDGFGLWSHGLTNKSFQVFYGTKYPFEVEYVIKNEYSVKRLDSVSLFTEAKRYHNEYDWAINPEITFDKSMIHNNIVCSGYLNLIPQKNNLTNVKNYPITRPNGSQDILISNKDNFRWNYNYFYNRVRDNISNIPFINYDKNQIEKYVNTDIVRFNGKRVLDRLEGDSFFNRLSYYKDSRFSLSLKFALNTVDSEI